MGIINRKPVSVGGITPASVGLGNVTNDAQVKASEKGAANGVAALGGDGKVPTDQLPAGTGGAGTPGPKGDKGDAGAAGAAGTQGNQGAAGVAGPKGDTGLTGPSGTTGLKGDKGDAGTQGPAGTAGGNTVLVQNADGSVSGAVSKILFATGTLSISGGVGTFTPPAGSSGGGGSTNAVPYSYYRLNITEASGSTEYLCLSELVLRDVAGGAQIATGGTATADSSFGAGYEGFRAFDNDPSTFWSTPSGGLTGTLQYQLSIAKPVVSYSLQAPPSGRASRSPKAWTLEGTNSGNAWVVLHTVADAGPWTDSQIKTYTI